MLNSDDALDEDQLAAAGIAPGERQVVIAPAGTGKTESVAALVESLVTNGGVLASQGILILTFSRAAVSAIRRRLAGKDAALRATNVRTLDALAARLISTEESAGEPARSFDGRIEQATKVLRRDVVSDELAVVEHVIVDEVQDVVGVRAEFVLEILRATRSHAGFTVLGDPQQAIYNFQIKDTGGVTSGQFLGYLDQQFAPELRALGTNYRAESEDSRRFASLGFQLDGLPDRRRIEVVRRELASVTTVGDVSEMPAFLSKWAPNRTAFLCETNGVALAVRDSLRANGVEAALQSSAEQRGAAAWVARAVDASKSKMKRSAFVEQWDDTSGRSAADAWRLLKQAERDFKTGDSLQVARLARAVALRDVPAELLEPADADVVVSTVHRSKGLEFDNVLLVNTGRWLSAEASNDDASEAYVALTRSRDRVFAVDQYLDRGLRRDKMSDRWVLQGREAWQTFGFEIRPADTRTYTDPGRAPDVSQYIRDETRIGDEVDLRLNKVSSDLSRPVYDVEHRGRRIGVTSEDFGFNLQRRLGSIRKAGRGWPHIQGLRIDGFETRGCGPELAHPDVLSLWLGVVVTGMARLDWNGEDE
ncbi:AAA family ATPase [Aeromicrobium sp. S22]|uniref:UvrD-helicase domain-containing protein n=1 Tax=Aeromicrobium sp. S22 TaxID=2662029 RepID=UPI00129E7E6F|nr:UvrD-helicase domain-containing protein [Aeromicrobium sp. S22]MRK01375.1 AAA family ATPase [Aeromicrobium sp. S22]